MLAEINSLQSHRWLGQRRQAFRQGGSRKRCVQEFAADHLTIRNVGKVCRKRSRWQYACLL